ncbi:MAG: type II toxin-antitoxin system HicB family antitoxin [Nitrospirota bacterium]
MGKFFFNIYLKKGIDGFIIAECLEISGCMSQGRTVEEAKENIKDAIKECLSVILEDYLIAKRRKRRFPKAVIEKEKFKISPFEIVAV